MEHTIRYNPMSMTMSTRPLVPEYSGGARIGVWMNSMLTRELGGKVVRDRLLLRLERGQQPGHDRLDYTF